MRVQRAGGVVSDRMFGDLPSILQAGDLLVLNDTRVVPAKFSARRATGGRIDGLFLHERADGAWDVLLRSAGRCRVGERLVFDERFGIILESRGQKGQWQVRPDPPAPAADILDVVGVTPLPPYIRRPGPMADQDDRQSYQTVFASTPGAVAAPTAGLHFTESLLGDLESRGVGSTRVTLHVGMGTFAPVKAASLAEHHMHSEWYNLPPSAAADIERTRAAGGRIVAVGTTAVRVLESAARNDGPLAACSGWTDIFIYPPGEFALVDALITNFHLPASTLIMLVAAFCTPGSTDGIEMILNAYRQAVGREYRFFSYGDAMIIE